MRKTERNELIRLVADQAKENLRDVLGDNSNTLTSFYHDANLFAKQAAMQFNQPLHIVCGIIAALSPRNKWETNLRDTLAILKRPSMKTKVSTFNNNKLKALNIIRHSKTKEDTLAILNGRKVSAFFNNLMLINSANAVTVDVWMYRAANLPPTDLNYTALEIAIKELALENETVPYRIQEQIWQVVREAA